MELLTLKGHTGFVLSVAFSPDGERIASGSWDRMVKVWDSSTGMELLPLNGHIGDVLSVAFSPDGKRIVTGSGDNTVKVWDSSMGMELLPLKGHTGDILSVAFSPDGKRIVSGSADNMVKVWEATPSPPNSGASKPSLAPLSLSLAFDPTWHQREADRALSANLPFSAVFHFDRLLAGLPDQRSALLQERNAILLDMRATNALDSFPALRLARAALWAPASVKDPNTLLPTLAAVCKDRPSVLEQRLHAGLLLRTGSPREAVPILQACIQARDHDAPPVEELLLALAQAALEMPDEARKHLDCAVTWMERGQRPIQAAAVVGALPGGWPTVLPLVHAIPLDPRLNPLDWETRLELEALRAEAEKALARKTP
jgi:hypothetical protein